MNIFVCCRFNDIPLIYDEKIYSKLKNNNIDDLLAQHVAHLFIRDTVSLFSEKVHQNDEIDTDHFEVSENVFREFAYRVPWCVN